MKKMKLYLASLAVAVGVVAAPLVVATEVNASPASEIKKGVTGIGGKKDDCAKGTQSCELTGKITSIVNVFLFIIGAVAVVMIIIGGLRYVISAGDSSAVTGAKNTILYAVVGLVVAILAYAIVNFVVGSLLK